MARRRRAHAISRPTSTTPRRRRPWSRRSGPTRSSTSPGSRASTGRGPTPAARCARTCSGSCTSSTRCAAAACGRRCSWSGAPRSTARCGPEEMPHPRGDAAAARLALRGEQGRAGRARSPLRAGRRHAGRADADLPPHRPRPRRGVRRELVRAADRRDRGGARGPRWSRSATSTRCATSPTCATWCARTGCSSRRARAARPTTCAPAAARRFGDVLDALLAPRPPGSRCASTPSRLRPSDVPAHVGDPSRLRRGHGLAAAHPLRADAAGPARRLAGAHRAADRARP